MMGGYVLFSDTITFPTQWQSVAVLMSLIAIPFLSSGSASRGRAVIQRYGKTVVLLLAVAAAFDYVSVVKYSAPPDAGAIVITG
jgi:hypothetical protein